MKWQPIETAIRDEETPILILTKPYGVCEAWFFKGDDEYGPCWVCCNDIFQIEVEYSEHGYFAGQVTHWMPLPEEPKPESGKDCPKTKRLHILVNYILKWVR